MSKSKKNDDYDDDDDYEYDDDDNNEEEDDDDYNQQLERAILVFAHYIGINIEKEESLLSIARDALTKLPNGWELAFGDGDNAGIVSSSSYLFFQYYYHYYYIFTKAYHIFLMRRLKKVYGIILKKNIICKK